MPAERIFLPLDEILSRLLQEKDERKRKAQEARLMMQERHIRNILTDRNKNYLRWSLKPDEKLARKGWKPKFGLAIFHKEDESQIPKFAFIPLRKANVRLTKWEMLSRLNLLTQLKLPLFIQKEEERRYGFFTTDLGRDIFNLGKEFILNTREELINKSMPLAIIVFGSLGEDESLEPFCLFSPYLYPPSAVIGQIKIMAKEIIGSLEIGLTASSLFRNDSLLLATD